MDGAQKPDITKHKSRAQAQSCHAIDIEFLSRFNKKRAIDFLDVDAK